MIEAFDLDGIGRSPSRFDFAKLENMDGHYIRQADDAHLTRIIQSYKAMGFKTAIDDFGAGFSGLTRLAKFQPDIVKLDMELVRDIHRDRVRRALARSVAGICDELGLVLLAEGIETVDESDALRDLGIDLQQGFLFARPLFEGLPAPALAESAARVGRAA